MKLSSMFLVVDLASLSSDLLIVLISHCFSYHSQALVFQHIYKIGLNILNGFRECIYIYIFLRYCYL